MVSILFNKILTCLTLVFVEKKSYLAEDKEYNHTILIMSKEKISIEYPMKGSAAMIWRYIGTVAGLSPWFADKTEAVGKSIIFRWGKTETRTAHIVTQRNGVYVKMRWDDEDPNTYFEMRIAYNELTREHTLVVTDFADKGETTDQIDLWDSQIEVLRRLSGM